MIMANGILKVVGTFRLLVACGKNYFSGMICIYGYPFGPMLGRWCI